MTQLHVIADRLPDAEASAAAIELLEATLEQARKGLIVGLAVITVTKDRAVHWETIESNYTHEVISGLAHAQHDQIMEGRDG